MDQKQTVKDWLGCEKTAVKVSYFLDNIYEYFLKPS